MTHRGSSNPQTGSSNPLCVFLYLKTVMLYIIFITFILHRLIRKVFMKNQEKHILSSITANSRSFLLIYLSLFSFQFSQEILLPSLNYNDQIIYHNYYTLNYSEEHEQASWVAYILKDIQKKGIFKRSNNFRLDPKVRTGSASVKDYKMSGYDRGHLAPASDMSFSSIAMSESFYLSNISPQVAGFNRGIWKRLESLIRGWVKTDLELQIVTGGVLNNSFKRIGSNNVSVPDFFYKVILDIKEPGIKGIGFILPNKGSKLGLEKYAMSIDEVEDFTGINFFESLPDDLENKIESRLDLDKFNFLTSNQKSGSDIHPQIPRLKIEKININLSSKSELMNLPGIGDKLSTRIIKYRNINGHFNSINDIQKVKGIGLKTANKLKPFIFF